MRAKYILMASVVVGLILAMDGAEIPSRNPAFAVVDGQNIKGVFVDVGEKGKIFARYSAISDSGIEVEKEEQGKLVWRVQIKSLGLTHGIYAQDVEIRVSEGELKIKCEGTGGGYAETRALIDGGLLKRIDDLVNQGK
jgi:hypothetical protein